MRWRDFISLEFIENPAKKFHTSPSSPDWECSCALFWSTKYKLNYWLPFLHCRPASRVFHFVASCYQRTSTKDKAATRRKGTMCNITARPNKPTKKKKDRKLRQTKPLKRLFIFAPFGPFLWIFLPLQLSKRASPKDLCSLIEWILGIVPIPTTPFSSSLFFSAAATKQHKDDDVWSKNGNNWMIWVSWRGAHR